MINKVVLLELVDKILGSWWTVIAGLSVGIAVAFFAMGYLPKSYKAGTTVLVIPPQIPETLMRSTVTDDMSMRLQALREAVLSRSYMEQLIHENYSPDIEGEQLDSLIRSVTRRMEVGLLRIDQRRGGGVFQLAFRDSDPERAARVVNSLTTFYIDQNIQFRTGQAESTEGTIESLLGEVEARMRGEQNEIAAYKELHPFETQDHYNANLQLLNSRQSDLEVNLREQGEARDDLETRLAEKEQAERDALYSPGAGGAVDSPSAQLRRLQNELKNLEARYSASHPDVVKKRKELERFLDSNPAAGEESGGAASGAPVEGGHPILLARIESARNEITRLEGEEERIRNDIVRYKRRIENTPRVAQRLEEMTQDYTLTLDQYKNYKAKLENARAAKDIEQRQQGERFEIIEKARAPYRPTSPNTMVVYGASIMAGIGMFLAPLALLFFISPVVRSEAGLADSTDTPILISIPTLHTPQLDRERRGNLLKNLLFSVLSILAAAAVVVVA